MSAAPAVCTVDVVWDRPSFHGLRADRDVDWPPSPVRLLGALVSGAYALDSVRDREAALAVFDRWCAGDQPVIDAPVAHPLDIPDTFTQRSSYPVGLSAAAGPNGRALKDVLDLSILGMDTASRVAKPLNGVALETSRIRYHVRGGVEEYELRALTAACSTVGYFGRSSDPASMSVQLISSLLDADGLPHRTAGLQRLRPVEVSTGPTWGWRQNTQMRMDLNHQRTFDKGSGDDGATPPPLPPDGYVTRLRYRNVVDSEDLLTFPFDRSVPGVRVPEAMRVLSAALDSALPLFPLVDVGRSQADGRCVGVGMVKQPAGQSDLDIPGLLTSLESTEFTRLCTGQRVINPRSVQADAWTGGSAGSRQWRSATPYRGFPDERVLAFDLDRELRRTRGVGLRSVSDPSMEPRHPGQVRWRSGRYLDGFRLWWLDIELDEAIQGPLIAGANAEHGFGVFRPLDMASAA